MYTKANFAQSTLAAGIAASATSVNLAPGTGARFPQSGSFLATIYSQGYSAPGPGQTPAPEIVVAALSSTDTLTLVTRAAEGPNAASAWSAGDNIVNGLTAGTFADYVPSPDKCRIYLSAAQSLTANVWTKIALGAVSFDTNGVADVSTNHRVTPKKAGYYHVSYSLGVISMVDGEALYGALFKSGNLYSYFLFYTGSGGGPFQNAGDIVYCNGTTDYFELYGYNANARAVINSSAVTFLNVMGPF